MKDIIQKEMGLAKPQTQEEELNLLKELSQKIILYGLSKTDFFQFASFQGGTCLRIIHGLNRFSEDLDFSLKKSDKNFNMVPYLNKIQEMMELYGYDIEISGKDRLDTNICARMLKDNNLLKQLNLKHHHNTERKIKIKIGIDLNPPENALLESNYVDFPVDFAITTHDRSSLFAGKCHALLHRTYTKGRDWYDYLWYIRNRIEMNWSMLESALKQSDCCPPQLEKIWLKKALLKKIKEINWSDAKRDIEKFLNLEEQESLKLWSEDFFSKKTEKYYL